MPPTVLSPCFGPAFWAAFRVDPPAGDLLVPVLSGEGAGVRSEALHPANAEAFAASALRVIEEVQGGDGAEGLAEAWSLEKLVGGGVVKTGVVASGPDGRHVRLVKVATQGSERSLKVEAGFRRPFGHAFLNQSVTVERNHCHLVAVYEIRFDGPVIHSLREFLGLPPRATLQELAAKACLALDATGLETDPKSSLVRRNGRREERSAAGTAPEGQSVVLIWGSQRARGGGIDEDLVIYVHASRESSALPPRAVGFWELIETGAAKIG
ncbi:MAG TPA: hypothetical protein VFX30_12155 [bacterium]|nr:hypothetical protein [bacterium]